MSIVERLIAAFAIVAAAHFSMGFINSSAGGQIVPYRQTEGGSSCESS